MFFSLNILFRKTSHGRLCRNVQEGPLPPASPSVNIWHDFRKLKLINQSLFRFYQLGTLIFVWEPMCAQFYAILPHMLFHHHNQNTVTIPLPQGSLLLSFTATPTTPPPQATTNFSPGHIIMFFQEHYINGVTQYVIFWDFSFSINPLEVQSGCCVYL